MSIISRLVNESRELVHQTEKGIHPSETQHHLKKLEDKIAELKETHHYLDALIEECRIDCERGQSADRTAVGLRILRDKRSLAQMFNHLRSCVDHLRGHDWGIFSK